jgi:hypothetical protein
MRTSNSREHVLGLHSAQLVVYNNPARFRVLVAGRRFGKTQLALIEMFIAAQKKGATVWYIAPSYRQAKAIVWNRLKKLTRPYWAKLPTETDLTVHLTFGSTISLRGADRPDSIRGNGLDFAVLDEFASMHAEVWTEVIRPALSDRKGRALFIGTPKGRNHFFDLYEYAKSKVDPDWAAFQFTTAQGGIVDLAEIQSAAKQLDSQTFLQEYEAQFTGVGQTRVYYPFNRDTHVKPIAFDPMRPLAWTLDFNVNPMSMLLIQRVEDMVHVLDEIVLKNSNTTEACKAFLDWLSPEHKRIPAYQRPLPLRIYGDASGHADRTSASATDWTLIRHFFSHYKGQIELSFHVNNVNPLVRDRVNCVNSRLESYLGDIRVAIHPRCTELMRDLEKVVWKIEPNGRTGTEIDKSDPMRTHLSDALGYYLAQEFPLRPPAGPNSSGRVV